MKRTLTVLVLLTACALLLLMGAALVEGPVLLMPPGETELPPAVQPLLARWPPLLCRRARSIAPPAWTRRSTRPSLRSR